MTFPMKFNLENAIAFLVTVMEYFFSQMTTGIFQFLLPQSILPFLERGYRIQLITKFLLRWLTQWVPNIKHNLITLFGKLCTWNLKFKTGSLSCNSMFIGVEWSCQSLYFLCERFIIIIIIVKHNKPTFWAIKSLPSIFTSSKAFSSHFMAFWIQTICWTCLYTAFAV